MASQVLEIAGTLDAELEAIPNLPAVFLIHVRQGQPYLARTNVLRRRLKRLLGPRDGLSRMLHLREIASRVEYWLVASRLSSALLFYELALAHFPEEYEKLVKFRWPSHVRLLWNNTFPRTQVTSRVGAGGAQFGPFRSRASAEEFEQGMLDLFQVRRCQDDLAPSPDHPGCIYGEMNRCMRPCQEAVSVEEYREEARRAGRFLKTGGASMVHSLESARDRLSENLDFEEAARQQQRLEALNQILRLGGDLARDVEQMQGAAVLRAVAQGTVELRFLSAGIWLPPVEFETNPGDGLSAAVMVPLDRRLRELIGSMPLVPKVSARMRQEHLALLARWYYSSWRDGDWIAFESAEKVPYRKLVNAIARQAKPPAHQRL